MVNGETETERISESDFLIVDVVLLLCVCAAACSCLVQSHILTRVVSPFQRITEQELRLKQALQAARKVLRRPDLEFKSVGTSHVC